MHVYRAGLLTATMNIVDDVGLNVLEWRAHESRIEQLQFVPRSKLTPAQSSLHVCVMLYTMTVIRISVATVTASLAAKISHCAVRIISIA